ncbi:hypothetical protein QE152_g7762 [Popillia japonica]|uniref:Uncharacterized protein n=1 Tax=Popillia japonica TaxID=7064 RepID=A0AAW1M7W4_POPJA
MILKIVAKTNTDLSQLQGTVNQLKNENISTQKQIADLENKIEYLENQTRRNNIVIYGVPEDDRETWEATEIKATDIIKNYIKVDISGADVERAHRIGKKVDNEERPIIVRFVNYKYKERILKCAKNLAGTRFAVTENFSARILQQRKLLKPYLMEAKKAGKRAHLKYNKLIIEGKPPNVRLSEECTYMDTIDVHGVAESEFSDKRLCCGVWAPALDSGLQHCSKLCMSI